MNHRFLQIHYFSSYAATLLNRDDVGFAKRIPFGGATRTRVSSQCLKRHWRTADGLHALSGIDVPGSIRSRLTFEKLVVAPLVEEGLDEASVRAVTEAFMAELLGESAKAKKAKEAGEDGGGKKAAKEETQKVLQTGQLTVLGRPEIEFVLGEVRAVCAGKPAPDKIKALVKERLDKEAKKNLQALKHASGLDAALFGRMVTSDILSRGDAAVHVAHALTVHAEETETDYFSALDELLRSGDDEQMGSAHINTSELTSGLFYGYVVVDVPLLVSNLEGCKREEWTSAERAIASQVVERLVHLIATVSPGAKLGSTAPYSYAQALIVESGNAQPRTFANAFLEPVPARPHLLRNTYERLSAYVSDLDAMYGKDGLRAFAALGPVDALEGAFEKKARLALPGLAAWAGERVRGE